VEELSVDKHEFLASVMPEALKSFEFHDGDLWRWRALLAVTAMVWETGAPPDGGEAGTTGSGWKGGRSRTSGRDVVLHTGEY